jgi:hypothetical protein
LVSGLGVLPLYSVGRRFYSPAAARLAAAGYAYLPALLVFAGRFDVVYALVGLAGLWLALRAVLDGDRPAALVLAAMLAAVSFLSFTALPVGAFVLAVAAACVWERRDGGAARSLLWTAGAIAVAVLLLWGGLRLALGVDGVVMWRVGQEIHRIYRLNYPAWFLFNLYDLAVFMGIVPFAGAVGAAAAGLWGRDTKYEIRDTGYGIRNTGGRGLALGWAAAVLLLNLSATVRAETGRLWLFVMPLGLLAGLAWFAGAGEGSRRDRRWPLVLFGAFLVQALVTGYLLGGRAGEPATPAPQWRLPASATAVDYRLGESVALRGYEMAQEGERLRLTLYWRALDFPRAEYSAFVHALDAEGGTLAQSDGPPAGAPMWCWVPGEVATDVRLLAAPPGTQAVGVGLYDPLTGARLSVSPPAAEERIVLPLPAE